MKTCKTGQTGVRSVDCTNVNFLVLILYYSYLKCYHWGQLDKRYVGPLDTNFGSSYEAIITSKLKTNKQTKKNFLQYTLDQKEKLNKYKKSTIPPYLPPEKPIRRSRSNRNGHGTTDWFQIGKGVHQGCILSPCLFNLDAEHIMRNDRLDEAHAGIKIAGQILITSDMQMTPLLWQKVKRN